jgi:G3E family GTPase
MDDAHSSLVTVEGGVSAVITVVDAKHIMQHLDEVKPEGVENESVEQIAFADRVLLNKVDLATEEELAAVERRIRSINSGVQILRTRLRPPDGSDAKIDLAAILDVDAFNLQKILESEPDFLAEEGHAHEHDKSIGSVGFRLPAEMNVGKLNAWIQALMEEKGIDLYRYKVLPSSHILRRGGGGVAVLGRFRVRLARRTARLICQAASESSPELCYLPGTDGTHEIHENRKQV